MSPFKIAVLDDYQGVALQMADWSTLGPLGEVTVFDDHLHDAPAIIARLWSFDVVCVMRERTPITREILEGLPNLKLIASTGPRNAAVDTVAAAELGVEVAHTSYFPTPTIELTWALILASARNILTEAGSVRTGSWQQGVGSDLAGRTLGVIGLGNIGRRVAQIGAAFHMNVIAWSPNLPEDRTEQVGVTRRSKGQLLEESDIVTLHMVLADTTRGLVGAPELSRMKHSAWLVNTSRGPIVDEGALIDALRRGSIAGAALDVFNEEPLPQDHPFRQLPNVLATPHLGYVSRDLYTAFYEDTVQNIRRWMDHRT